MTALRAIEAWAEEDPKNHMFLTVLYDKSDAKTDTFVPSASGNLRDIATALAYTAWKSPDFENLIKVVFNELPKYKELMNRNKGK